MTIEELIKQVKDLRPGTPYVDGTFIGWVNDLEADLVTEVYLFDISNFTPHTAKTDSVTIDAAHTKVFWSYLMAMVSLANGEMSRYNNDFTIFNGFWNQYKTWYDMTYRPTDSPVERYVYMTAYSLAVKYGYTGTEEEWVAYISANAEAAQTAQAGAETAQAAAEAAQAVAENVAAQVESDKTAASGAATAAAASAATAAEAAQAAATSATAAASKATEAAASATTAAEKAANAETSAGNAATALASAVTAKTAAEAAQAAAETAKTAAETAKGLAETAKTAAEAAKTDAISAKDAAETAKTAAESAQSLAVTAKNAALGAQTAAEAAKTAAETAAGNAETSALDAEAWAVGQRGGVDVGSSDPAYHNNAKYYKDQAAEIVGGDYATKTEAQGYATTAKNEAISAAATDATTKANAAQAAAEAASVPLTQKGAASGVAELDSAGKVPSAQLPSYVDDVLEYANLASFPVTGESGKIYVALDTNKTYRWSGSAYVEISASLALGETSSSAYRGDHGKDAYDHSQASGNPHSTTAAQVGAATRLSGTATLAVANWAGSAAPYSYALTVAGMLATDTPHVDRVTGTDATAAAAINTAWALISGYAVKPQTSADTITFYASAIPTVAIPIMYEAVRT